MTPEELANERRALEDVCFLIRRVRLPLALRMAMVLERAGRDDAGLAGAILERHAGRALRVLEGPEGD